MHTRLYRTARAVVGRVVRPSVLGCVAIALIGAFVVFLFSSSPEAPAASTLTLTAVQGKERPMAPDLVGGVDWLNTDKPLNMAALKGRVVLLDFWTLCCINCIHIMPDLAKLEARYPNVLVVIGVHSPKFENEKKSASIFKAILRYEIKHPVVNDADHKIWNAYGVRSWPTLVLIDPDGKYYGSVSGEGNLATLDMHIGKLVKEFTANGKLKKDAINFNLAREKDVKPIYFPGKVLADAESKRLFIADSTNHRIVITNLEGKKIAIAGTGKEGMQDGKFAEAQFSDPQGMCLDGDTLYVADRKNHAIRALDLKNETVTRVAGTGVQNHIRAGGAALKTGLNSPWDLLLHGGRIYVAMAGHHQIWTFDPAKKRVDPYAGSGREDLIDGPLLQTSPVQTIVSAFAQPSGLATDGKRIFVADSEISAIRALPVAGVKGQVGTIVGEGLFEFGDKNGQGKAVRLQHALGVVYHEGKLYVADTYNSKIKIIDPAFRTCETYLGDGKSLNEPGGLSISGGKMYIADTNNHRIQVVDMKTKEMSTLPLVDVEPVRREWMTGTKEEKK